MIKQKILFTCLVLLLASSGIAQRVVYSEADRDDARNMNFEIIGKYADKILVYKGFKDFHSIVSFDEEMKMLDKQKLQNLPDRIINIDFLWYPNQFYMFYQYQKKSIVYCMVAKFDASGKQNGDAVQLDTTDISYAASNKLYSVIFSEDKQKIAVLKINNKNEKYNVVTSALFNKDLSLIKKTRLVVNMPDRNDFLEEFVLDNDGTLFFLKVSGSAQNDNITKVQSVTLDAGSSSSHFSDIRISGLNLDDIRVKADNANKRFLITSYYSKQRRGNVDGIFCSLWDKVNHKEVLNTTAVFSDELRIEAKGENSIKSAFNDYFIKNIISRKDGGFIVIAEALYTSTRGGTFNRWDMMGMGGFGGWGMMSPMDYYMWGNPWGWGGWSPWNRFNNFNNNNITRFFSDNIVITSFDDSARIEWSNVIRKSQFDDNTDNFISFGTANTGSQIHFLFTTEEKRTKILSDQSISPEGQLTRNPTFKNLDRGYEFMVRHSKQVSNKVIVIPCMFRNYLCFAKIEL